MSRKSTFAIVSYIVQSLFFFLIFVGSAVIISAASATTNPETDLVKNLMTPILFYGIFCIILATVGIIFAAKHKEANLVLNIQAIISSLWCLTQAIVGIITLNYLGENAAPEIVAALDISIAVLIVLGLVNVVACFLHYESHRKLKCSLMIISPSVAVVVYLIGLANNSSNFLILIALGLSLVLPILYLASPEYAISINDVHGFESDSPYAPKPDEDIAASLRKLETLHESGLISDEEYESKRQKYVDRL